MSINFDALRAKLAELKGNTTRSEALWKPTDGENHIRIVPLKNSPDNPFTELLFHYLGTKTYLSPLTFGEPDPIAEFGDALRSEGGLSKEAWRETKKFTPQRRTYVPIIDRKKPEDGVKFWAFGKTVYSEILSIMADPDYGDITDPQTGRDIKVIFTPQNKSDTGFAKTSIRVSPKQTALTSSSDQLKQLLTDQPDLMSLYKKMTYDEMKVALESYINGTQRTEPSNTGSGPTTPTSTDDWDTPAEVVESPSAAKSRGKSSKTETADVDQEFAKLFGK